MDPPAYPFEETSFMDDPLRKLRKSVMLLGFQPRGNLIKDLLNVKEPTLAKSHLYVTCSFFRIKGA